MQVSAQATPTPWETPSGRTTFLLCRSWDPMESCADLYILLQFWEFTSHVLQAEEYYCCQQMEIALTEYLNQLEFTCQSKFP